MVYNVIEIIQTIISMIIKHDDIENSFISTSQNNCIVKFHLARVIKFVSDLRQQVGGFFSGYSGFLHH